jgi:glycerol-3-phosphate acyltransferase PlsY
MTHTYIIIGAVSYLLGSIPFGYILVRLFMKQDIRATGSGNIGATNVARSGAKGLAIATLLLDAGKGYLGVIAGVWLYNDGFGRITFEGPGLHAHWLLPHSSEQAMLPPAIAALFAIIGHCFPIWLKFKGGKGVATGVGAFAALAPRAVLLAVIVFAVVFIISRYVSLASVAAAAIFPIAVYAVDPGLRSPALLSLIVASSALIVVKHHDNIRRLITGTESRFGARSA